MLSLAAGIRRHPWKVLGSAIAAFGVQWTAIDAFTYFFPTIKLQGLIGPVAITIVALGYGIARYRSLKQVDIQIHHTNSRIQVMFGDLFLQPGFRAIAVSQFFESEIGVPVAEKSLHGIFLKRCFGGRPEAFDAIITQQLSGIVPTITPKAIGKTKEYPIGTTALVAVNQDNYLCFALTKTDPTTCKVSANVEILWQALAGLWKRARDTAGGNSINLPLVGSALAGIGLPSKELLNLLILSIVDETKRRVITDTIRIVIGKDRIDQIDLREAKRYWR